MVAEQISSPRLSVRSCVVCEPRLSIGLAVTLVLVQFLGSVDLSEGVVVDIDFSAGLGSSDILESLLLGFSSLGLVVLAVLSVA